MVRRSSIWLRAGASSARYATLVLLVAAASTSWARGKIIDFKRLPQTDPGLVEFLAKSKDQPFRIAASIVLDTHLREKGREVKEAPEVDQVLDAVLGKLFENMVADTDIYTWDKDNYGPRGDVVCKNKVLVYPGRVSPTFEKQYALKVNGKRIDRGYVGQDCTLTASAAQSEEEWHQWTATKGWGLNPHAVFIGDNVARIGVTFYSPGTAAVPTPRVERPVYIGFVSRAKDTEPWKVLSVEPPVAIDYRKQESNVFPVDSSKPTEYEKKLRLANWMEAVRILNPIHENFLGQEGTFFQMAGQGNDVLDPYKDKGLIELYRKAESPLVRAAAELKLSKMGDPPDTTAFADLIGALKHPAARTEVIRGLVKAFNDRFNANAAANEADTAALALLISPDPKKPVPVRELKIVDDIARMRVTGQKFDGWLFRKFDDGWQILGPIR